MVISNELIRRSSLPVTEKLFRHIRDDTGPYLLKVFHRFSDSCAAHFKSNSAFDHLTNY